MSTARSEFTKATKLAEWEAMGRPRKEFELTNIRVGHWLILHKDDRKDYGKTFWTCRCDCGIIRPVYETHLRNGSTQCCGCTKPGTRTHGKTRTPEWRIWLSMRNRCKTHPRYAGRGIKVCDRWKDFKNFLVDMGTRPSPTHTLERINNNGNYEPSNCKWATYKEQARNTRRNRFYLISGSRLSIAEIAEIYKINYSTLHYRLDRMGLSIENAIK